MDTTKQESEDQSVKITAEEYSAYLKILEPSLTNPEKDCDVDASIEAVLTRLDEFYGMLDMIRVDTTKVTDEVLQNFRAERDRLKLIYQKIDDLEKFMNIIKSDCNSMEQSLKDSEAQFGAMSSIKKALGGLRLNFWEKKQRNPSSSSEKETLAQPSIFNTSDYISPKNPN